MWLPHVRCSTAPPAGLFCSGDQAAFFEGTLAPAFLAFDNPIAIACLGLRTVLPLRPLFSFPCFISCISSPTYWPALGLYLRPLPVLFDRLLADFDRLEREWLLRLLDFVVLPERPEDLLRDLLERPWLALRLRLLLPDLLVRLLLRLVVGIVV